MQQPVRIPAFCPPFLHRLLVLVTLACGICAAQSGLKVSFIEGTAKIQRAEKRSWDRLAIGDNVNDNDVLETFFQAKVVLACGVDNYLIFGSDSKALLNLDLSDARHGVHVNVTLFSGGVFIKAVSKCDAQIFTSNAVCVLDSGVITAVVDARTSHTGFHVLGGSAGVRNIAQQEQTRLSSGQTTIVAPGKRPEEPAQITNKHVTVLKHFFGADYVEREMKSSNIVPAADAAPSARLSFSRSLEAEIAPQPSEEMRYKPLFDYDMIYGRIADEQRKSGRRYRGIAVPLAPHGNSLEAGISVSGLYAGGTLYPCGTVSAGVFLPMLSAKIKVPVSYDYTGAVSPHLKGSAGALDKIDYIYIGKIPDSLYVYIGPIDNYTIGNGLVVDRFSNANPYSAVTTAGARMHLKRYPFNLKGFIADISEFAIGGVHLMIEPGSYQFGLGWFFDSDQTKPLAAEGVERVVKLPDGNSGQPAQSGNCYELDAGFDLVNNYKLRLHFLLEFAQKINERGTDGFVLNGPGLLVEWAGMKADAGFYMGDGRMLRGQFHPFYMTNRRRVSGGDTIVTQNGLLSPKRRYNGFFLDVGAVPVEGASLNFSWSGEVFTRSPFTATPNDVRINNYSLGLSAAIDDSLMPMLKFGEIYARQIHGGYFPAGARLFSSWGVEAGLNVLTAPIYANIACEGGLRIFYLDLDDSSAPSARFNQVVDHGERLVEVYAGVRWGFL